MEDWIELGQVTATGPRYSETVTVCVRNVAGKLFYAARIGSSYYAIARVEGREDANACYGRDYYFRFGFPD